MKNCVKKNKASGLSKSGLFKKIVILVCIFSVAQIFLACGGNTNEKYDLIRIHIRADSNISEAQAVKLKVRDSVTAYLTNELNGITDYATAYAMLEARLQSIEIVASGTLASNGFGYRAKAKLNNEYFPTRTYDGIVVVSGYYDALIIELGEAKGDNWWCVIYPPLCYVEASGTGGDSFKYKSWFSELWQKVFNKSK